MEPAFAERKHKTAAPRTNRTGIPGGMKQDFETRSGLSFDDVRVHYNSQKPAKLGALAYTRGTQVYLGPGQERHLPHELGHVVQQKRGLVRPTGTVCGLPVNTDAGLEAQADHILQMKSLGPEFPGGVVQCCDPEAVEKIYQLCHDKHKFTEITKEQAQAFCRQLDQGKDVIIPGHNKVIKHYSNPFNQYDYRLIDHYYQGGGAMGRCAAEDGVDAIIKAGLSFEPVEGFSASRDFTKDSTAHTSSRPSLSTVMGGSAQVKSKVANAEYLHIIAHSLGGADDYSNLVPGCHALNTAMIPFESFVSNAVTEKYPVTYQVDFLPRPGFGVFWVDTAQIQICVGLKSSVCKGSWTISIPKNERLSKASFDQINEEVNKFKAKCGIQ